MYLACRPVHETPCQLRSGHDSSLPTSPPRPPSQQVERESRKPSEAVNSAGAAASGIAAEALAIVRQSARNFGVHGALDLSCNFRDMEEKLRGRASTCQ